MKVKLNVPCRRHRWIYYPHNPPSDDAKTTHTTHFETVGRTCELCKARENWHAADRIWIPAQPIIHPSAHAH